MTSHFYSRHSTTSYAWMSS